MSEVGAEEQIEKFHTIILEKTGVVPDRMITEFDQPKLSWTHNGTQASLVFSERPFLSIIEEKANPETRYGYYTVSVANHTDEQIMNALNWFKVI